MTAEKTLEELGACDTCAFKLLVEFLGEEMAMELLCEQIDELGQEDLFAEFVANVIGASTDEALSSTPSREDEEAFLRELEAMDDDYLCAPPPIKDTAEDDEASLGEPGTTEFIPDSMDLEHLAHSYLAESISLYCFSFFTGNCEENRAAFLMNRFEGVARHLGDGKRQELIDSLDRHRRGKDGDQWDVFKYSCKPGFWSTPAIREAILRVADSISDDLPSDQDHYGPEFLTILETIRETHVPNTDDEEANEGVSDQATGSAEDSFVREQKPDDVETSKWNDEVF